MHVSLIISAGMNRVHGILSEVEDQRSASLVIRAHYIGIALIIDKNVVGCAELIIPCEAFTINRVR